MDLNRGGDDAGGEGCVGVRFYNVHVLLLREGFRPCVNPERREKDGLGLSQFVPPLGAGVQGMGRIAVEALGACDPI